MLRRKETKEIILHCSATPEGRDIKAKDIRKWHKDQGWSDLGYHYIIDLDGTVEKGRDEALVGSHCLNHNNKSIGICYIGGCDKNMNAKDTRTYAQKEALLDLVFLLMEKYNIPLDKVKGHYTYAKKFCPCFTNEQFYREFNTAFNS